MRARIALLAAPLLLLPLGFTQTSSAARCAHPETARAYTTSGHPASYRGVACSLGTGFQSSETHLRVAGDGTIVQQPAEITPGLLGTGFVPGAPGPKPETQVTPAGFAISRDGGRTFKLVLPSGAQWVASDGAIHFDEASGRLYYYALSPVTVPASGSVPVTDQVPGGYAHMMTSADDGKTWFHTQIPGYLESENPRFASGAAPSGGDQPVPGESVAYWCGNTALFVYGQRDCYRTLDGGHTWTMRSTLLRRGVPVHPECGQDQEELNAGDGSYPELGPDGSLWVLIRCGGNAFLARSTDEAASFPVVRPMPAFDELRVDPKGVLYGVVHTGDALLLRTSRDAGRSWTAPVNLVKTPPAGISQWAVAVRGPGQLAVSYLSEHKGGGYDGSVTVLRHGLLVSATVHDGRTAMVTSPSSAKDDYIDLDVAPDGSAWGSFYGDCGKDPACQGSDPNPEAKVSVILHVG
jgi:hypothetical protein